MAGERTPDTTPGRASSSDDDISLREHLQRQLESLERHLTALLISQHDHSAAQLEALRARHDERWASHLVTLNERFEALATALTKAETAIEKRFDSVNEFRAQLNDQAHTFMPRSESISRHERNAEQLERIERHFTQTIAGLTARMDTFQGIQQGQTLQRTEGRQSNAAIYAMIGAAVAVLGAIVIIANLVGTR